ncbi:MAG: S8 family serine peptidase, partial [Alphaproteobacteria bacterium]|nr:S8 family serine peptidase [Alphaproteobacteria bacterium]
MRFSDRIALLMVSLLGMNSVFVSDCNAYGISAVEIYKQAKAGNKNYLSLLKRYNNAIDLTDKNGYTAYCLALKNDDKNTLSVLSRFGANESHKCVKQVELDKKNSVKKPKKSAYKSVLKKSKFKDESISPYWWWGLGGAAIAGGALALSGGGGGGGGSSSGVKYCHSCDINKGKGGNPDGSAELFKTKEYKNSSYLCGSLAAEAYSYMYSKDANGNLVSHQAGSTDALKKVKVGILDSGVNKNNSELVGKVVGEYDANDFNSDGDISGYDAGDVELYLYKRDGVYYPIAMIDGVPHGYGLEDENGTVVDITEDKLYRFFEFTKAHLGIDVDKSDFAVLNGAGGGAPGSDTDLLLEIFGDKYNIAYYKISNINHGSHVAGIIAGKKNDKGNHGVAFENAEIIAGSWDFEHEIEPVIKGMVNDGVSVLNHSWGYEADNDLNIKHAEELLDPKNDEIDTLKAYAYAANNGAVWVQATGNDGYSQPAVHLGMNTLDLSSYGYAGPGQYEVSLLAVAALDGTKATESAPSGMIADYSNRCGDAAGWCISAEGTNILSSNAIANGYEVNSGTSMATPVVSGSIALLQGYYPWLKAQNIAYLLLETANNRGEYAKSEIYGQGALDLEAAVTTPIGELGLPENQSLDSLKKIGLTKLSTSSVMQNQLLKAMPKTITAFDALKRPFEYETSKLINTTHSSNAN